MSRLSISQNTSTQTVKKKNPKGPGSSQKVVYLITATLKTSDCLRSSFVHQMPKYVWKTELVRPLWPELEPLPLKTEQMSSKDRREAESWCVSNAWVQKSVRMKEMSVRKVRVSGLHDPPHCGQAHVTICHVSPHSCRRTRCSKKRLYNLPDPPRPAARPIRAQLSQGGDWGVGFPVLGEVGSPRRSVGSDSPHFGNSTVASVTLAG